MSHYIKYSAFLELITFLSSLLTAIDTLDIVTDGIGGGCGLARTIKVQDNFDWQNNFQVHNTAKLFEQYEAQGIPLSSYWSAVTYNISKHGWLVRYNAGRRYPYDHLVAKIADTLKFSELSEVEFTFRYSCEVQSKRVTFLEIEVEQTSNIGRGTITEGGIGQREIKIFVKARDTYWFDYKLNVYGI